MKKFIVFLSLFLFNPFIVEAYSNEVILGGNTIGINIKTNGVMVIGLYKVNGEYPKTDLLEGDLIIKIGDNNVSSINELTSSIEKNINNNEIEITYLRGNKLNTTTLNLVMDNNLYKTGLYVKDSIVGIGTLTFIDPETNMYGALGHEIVESNTSKIIEVKTGSIFKSSISSITKSTDGTPGSKNAKFYYNNTFGDITKNTKYGIYGHYETNYDTNKMIKIATPDEVTTGPAKIYTVLKDETIEEFNIEITSVNENSKTKNLTFKIIDDNLENKTGGIVQGMSGSPIVQNDKLIGAVTHVITDNVKTGYGLFITTMLEESEK